MTRKSSALAPGAAEPPAVSSAIPGGDSLLAALFNSSTVGVAICDRQLRFRAINAALASMNGIPAEAHLGKTIHAILGSAAAKIQPAFDHVFATGQPLSNVEVIAELPARGIVGHWSESYFPIKDRAGEVREVGAVVLELTRGKELETSLRQLSNKILRVNSGFIRPIAGNVARTTKLLESCLSDVRRISHLLHSVPSLPAAPRSRTGRILHAKPPELLPTLTFASVYPVERESGPNPLSSREYEVFALIARGRTNKEIAGIMRISIRTVESHRAKVMLKLDLHSVTDLVRYALRNNLICA
jgi:DNA-binding CsgD family transcriptional regulator